MYSGILLTAPTVSVATAVFFPSMFLGTLVLLSGILAVLSIRKNKFDKRL